MKFPRNFPGKFPRKIPRYPPMFHEKSRNSHDSRDRTDTPGPGESVFAIQGPQKSQENPKIRGQNFQKLFFDVLSLPQPFPGLPSCLYIELAMENPNLQSKPSNFAVQRPTFRVNIWEKKKNPITGLYVFHMFLSRLPVPLHSNF